MKNLTNNLNETKVETLAKLKFNETIYEFQYDYKMQELTVFKNNNPIYTHYYNPLIVDHLTLYKSFEIITQNNL